MRELEAKFLIQNVSHSAAVGALQAKGVVFGTASRQVDYVHATSQEVLHNPIPGSIVGRVRVENDRLITLTVKQRRSAELDRTELELEINDGDIGRQIFSMLGMPEIVEVRKLRQAGKRNSTTSLMVDEVEGLGVFIEVEVLGEDDKSADERLEEAMKFVYDSIGAKLELTRVDKGYDRLLLEKIASS